MGVSNTHVSQNRSVFDKFALVRTARKKLKPTMPPVAQAQDSPKWDQRGGQEPKIESSGAFGPF